MAPAGGILPDDPTWLSVVCLLAADGGGLIFEMCPLPLKAVPTLPSDIWRFVVLLPAVLFIVVLAGTAVVAADDCSDAVDDCPWWRFSRFTLSNSLKNNQNIDDIVYNAA